MKHSFVPDLKKDADYLKKMSQAAKLGNVDAMMKLSAYAQRRLKFVESFYWAQMAHQAGCAAASAEQRKILVQWRARGCPGEHNNVRPEFTETNGSFARAILRLRSGIDVLAARQRLKRLAEKGDMAAKTFLEQQKKTR